MVQPFSSRHRQSFGLSIVAEVSIGEDSYCLERKDKADAVTVAAAETE